MVYNIFFVLFSIIYLPYLILKGKAHKDFLQRFGALPAEFQKIGKDRPVWVHTVSVGEVLASKQFVNQLGKECKKPIVISTTTKTGNDLAKETFGKDILKFYFPLDLTFVVKKTLNIINPSIFVIFETELWPNLIMELSRKKIPIVLLNGRISDSSYKGYRRIKLLFKDILNSVDLFCMQTVSDKERVIDIGAPPDRVKVTGNMKFDVLQEAEVLKDAILTKLGVKDDEKLLVAGSTHRGEEEIVLDVYNELLEAFPKLRLLIAPRHIDRSGRIAGLVADKGFTFRLLSNPAHIGVEGSRYPTVLILDTIGQLKDIFNVATIVFMGGSLVKRGGHNIVEPALSKKPVIFGPYMSNFRDMARIFLENEAAVEVHDKISLRKAISDLLKNDERAQGFGRNAKDLVEKHRGATRRNLDEVLEKMK